MSPIANKWVLLNKSDFKIFYYTERLTTFSVDVSVIRITNREKLKMIYTSHFKLGVNIDTSQVDSLHMAGYPFKKFAINSPAPDTMVTRVVAFKDAEYNSTKTMIALPVCSCPGDSGGPVWLEFKASYYLLGIFQGAGWEEQAPDNSRRSTAVFLYKEMASWISDIVARKAGDAFDEDE